MRSMPSITTVILFCVANALTAQADSSTLDAVQEQAKARMNLVAIVTDDQAAWTVGCYGGTEIATPNLNRLAAGGVRFENAFVHTPVCSPSRGTYLTSLQGTQLGYTDWLNDAQSKDHGITPAHPTWPKVLADHGYTTCFVGKWHVGSRDESLPWHNGIQRFIGYLGGGWRPNKVKFIDEKGGEHHPPGFSADICTDLAMTFIDEYKDRPFVVMVHYREPHAPYTPMPEPDMETSRKADLHVPDYPKLKEPYTSQQRRGYYASIAAVDRNVGRLLEHLDKLGLAEKTIVTFTSDHGYNIGEHGIQHKGNASWITQDRFRQPRPNMFDTSLRTPLLIRWPGQSKPGTVVKDWVTNADMGATVLGMLGVEKPAKALPQSRDYSAAVRGEKLDPAEFPHELYGQYDLINFAAKHHMRMIRTDDWKLIYHFNAQGEHELYDLAADPGERTNLFGKKGTEKTVHELTALLRKKMAAIHDPRLNELPN
jgi:arylsulfatase A-like enzyme